MICQEKINFYRVTEVVLERYIKETFRLSFDISFSFLSFLVLLLTWNTLFFYIYIVPYCIYSLFSNVLFPGLFYRKLFIFNKKKIPLGILRNVLYFIIYALSVSCAIAVHFAFILISILFYIIDWYTTFTYNKNFFTLIFKL